ncbi:hypothetical protein T440DRAFT_481107 [Plenodomus tracheiphilus IPT5]|uniref:Uncharacterized protein n=1 Tax=Plenodomus tracheiphilus IPT5 TaxID=1408161 RepID=A0A6A7B1P4_9PLEO|nr:hypothetical protein T440DRAFT_481107 [Plenodomus tracheiphilus IPT5]
MDYRFFEYHLLPHKHTLKHLSIGYLSIRGSPNIFNATLFPALESLSLSRWQTHSGIPPSFLPHDADILGPKLHTFTWDFDGFFQLYDPSQSSGWFNFGDQETEWVCALVRCVAQSGAALKRIRIRFTLEEWRGVMREGMAYPWEKLEELRDGVCKENGVEFVFDEPLISREAWVTFVGKRMLGMVLASDFGEDGIFDGAVGTERRSAAAEEQEAKNMLEFELQHAYQGEDIRGYLTGK